MTCLAPEAPLEPCELVRVVTGALAGAEPELVDACDGLVRVVTGAPADRRGGGGRTRGMGWCEWSPCRPPRRPCPTSRRCASRLRPCVSSERRSPPRRCVPTKIRGGHRLRDGARSCRTMWMVRRITCVRTARGDCAPQARSTTAAADRNEKPARPAASRAATAPAIRVCVLRILRASGWGGGVLCCARAMPRPTAGKASDKAGACSSPQLAISLPGTANLEFMSTCIRHDRSRDGIVIAGGGLAGQRCAESLRREGYERAIKLVCSEPHRPYDRPPLSKELLTDRSLRRPAAVPP